MTGVEGSELILVGLAVAVGALVQASIGFGFALISTPVLSLVAPEAVPSALLMTAAPMNLFVLAREREHVDRPGAARITVGMVLGTLAAVPILRALPQDMLTVAFGAAVVLAAATSALHPRTSFRPGTYVVAGAGSGLINTVAGTGGPLIALLYQARPGPVVRSTLAITFAAAVALSLAGQGAAGRLRADHVVLALALTPALMAGLWASKAGARIADRGWIRPAVLIFGVVSGGAAIAKGLL